MKLSSLPILLPILVFTIPARAAEPDYVALVRQCCDALIEKGRDRYGEVHSPLFMSLLDIETLEVDPDPPMLDGLIRTEGRTHRRNPGGSDLWEDQPLLRVLKELSDMTGDEKYDEAAKEYVAYFLAHCRKPSTGLLTWGSHIYWDAFSDAPGGDGDGTGPHEILIHDADWEFMWSVDPDAVRSEIEGIWEWHIVDKATGLHNRHDDRRKGFDFAFSGASFVQAFAFLGEKTGDRVWKDRARLIAEWHWSHRNTETNLAPDTPGSVNRYDGLNSFTTLPGPHAAILLRVFALTRDDYFREVALGHLRAYDRYGWDPVAESYWGMLALDGTPIPEADPDRERDIDSYDDFKPLGHVDLWRTVMYSYEFPIAAAQSYAYAAELTGDEEMLEATRRWAELIRRNLPAGTGRRWAHLLERALPGLDETGGTYAENYGRAIDFFLRAARVLDEPEYEETAREIAADAIAKLRHAPSGLFMGHAAKRTYEATDGVAYLLYALLQLQSYPDLLAPNL